MSPLRKPGHYHIQCCQLKREKNQGEFHKNSAGNKNKNNNSGQTNSNRNNKNANNIKNHNANNQNDSQLKLFAHPVGPVARLTTQQRSSFLEPMQQADRLLGLENRWDRVRTNGRTHKTRRGKLSRLWLKV